MDAKRGRRVGIGILLMIFGVCAIGGASSNPPVGAIQVATYYLFSVAVILTGLVLIIRKPKQGGGR
jgi:Ni,Fe-hydrogenase I cytochrome b subunit